MTAQYLPKPQLDLPTDLPKEIPAHSSLYSSGHAHSPISDEEHTTASHHTESKHPAHHENYEDYFSVRTLLAWQAPGRPFRKKGKEYYMSSLLIVLLVEILLFLFSQYMLMVVVVSLVFLSFTLASVPPLPFHYRISTEGITIEDHFFLWEELYDFYFKKRDTVYVLHVRTRSLIPGELTLTLGDMDKEHVKAVLLPYLPFREVIKPTFMEKSGDWLSKNFPLEKHHESSVAS